MTTSQHSIIGRQPVVNDQQQIIGYEFFFRNETDGSNTPFEEDIQTCARILNTTMDEMHESWLLGQQLAFINVDHVMLNSVFLELMPAEKTVLEVVHHLQVTPEILARCQELKQLKFRIALDNPQHYPHLEALLPYADFIKIDMRNVDIAQAKQWLKKYQHDQCSLIAEKVEENNQFQDLLDAGYHQFQGYFYAKPENISSKVINPSFDGVLHLLNLVSQEAENKDIENGFKRDTTLSYKLLRYINSVGFGLSCEVQSIGHALTILGRNQLYRWLTLLMVTAGNNSSSPALMKTSITRGRLTELLGEPFFEKRDRDNLFVVGVFSLLDVMLKVPMENILEKLQLPETIVDALVERQGIFGPFLKLTEACEDANNEEILEMAAMLQLKPEKVNQCHMEALAWTEALGI
ncbi:MULTISPECIES: EAL domain-containing protein [unclassified Methylophilus]|jgi:c-di-GMP phosphodiesterase|uniref:EAL and HDOD domain-containing protein n=1 Tax=Methylophilus glucosoxydans TaxID=752553 RepID=A0ABW3GE40_9PROT|nr:MULTISPECIES: EAL domain-containing protein [unclassified Methylophilus]MDF0379056.1 EAL domain-containing protein [Methylophilus sp. YYY-1]MDT7848619.1 EAL domain-containing protein [Methylophilus sp. VKM B-3414]BEV09483.1 EAL domain-containing protein [Methylophilus sp. DW102]